MSNVLSEQVKQQVIALGRLGWSLRRIQQETGVRRETASVYLKAAGIQVLPPGRRKQRAAKPAILVTTGSMAELAPPNSNSNTNPQTLPQRGKTQTAKPAIPVTTGFGAESSGFESENRTPPASACEPFREAIEVSLSRAVPTQRTGNLHAERGRQMIHLPVPSSALQQLQLLDPCARVPFAVEALHSRVSIEDGPLGRGEIR